MAAEPPAVVPPHPPGCCPDLRHLTEYQQKGPHCNHPRKHRTLWSHEASQYQRCQHKDASFSDRNHTTYTLEDSTHVFLPLLHYISRCQTTMLHMRSQLSSQRDMNLPNNHLARVHNSVPWQIIELLSRIQPRKLSVLMICNAAPCCLA